MEKLNLQVSDNYEVLQKSSLSDYDRKILIRLYQPICGYGAIALYFTLWSELEADKTITNYCRPHSALLSLLQCELSEFVNCRKKLEALGLIKTLRHPDGHYIFLLYAPKKPKEFYDYELFDAMLQSSLGKVEYERGKTYFSLAKYNDEDCVDISQTFNEVYHVNGNNYEYKKVDSEISRVSGTPVLSFDFVAFYLSLKDYYIKKSIITKEIEEEISLLATTYNISAKEMVNVVYKSLDNQGKINVLRLQKNARMQGDAPRFEEEPVKKAEHVDTGSLNLDKKVELYNTVKPLEFLELKNNGIPAMERDARLINELCVATQLPHPVINVLIDYCLQSNNNSLNRAYMQTIAGVLLRSKIMDAYDAMIFLTSKGKKTYTKKEMSVQKNYVPVEEEVSDEEIQESLRKLKELKEKRKNHAKG